MPESSEIQGKMSKEKGKHFGKSKQILTVLKQGQK